MAPGLVGPLVVEILMTWLLPMLTVLHIEGAVSRRKQFGACPVQLSGDQRPAVTSTAQDWAVTAALPASDPTVEGVKLPLQPTPLESQNWLRARTVTQEPLGMVPVTAWAGFFRGIEVAPALAPAPARTNIWPPRDT